MLKKSGLYLLPILLLSSTVVGCSNGSNGSGTKGAGTGNSPTAKSTKQPISMTIINGEPGALDFDQTGLADALKTKFPYITFDIVKRGKGSDYPDLISSGRPVDIIYEASSLQVYSITAFNFQLDLQDLIKKHNLDLARFEPNILAQTKNTNSDMKYYGIPLNVNKYALYYNKDIFDKFGVTYPKDGMTWDDAYELAKKLSRQDGGVFYQGFTTYPTNLFINNQLSLNPLDPKEDKAALNTDGWKALFLNYARFFQIPGCKIIDRSEFTKGAIAMSVDTNSNVSNIAKFAPTMNWDLVSIPTMKEKPNTGLMPAGLALFISRTSKYPDDAMDVVSYLVSDEIQTKLSRQGYGTPLASPTVQKAFAQDLPVARGKNTGALYYYKDAPVPPPRAANLINVGVDYKGALDDMLKNNTDVNTELTNLEDKTNKDIEKAKANAGKK